MEDRVERGGEKRLYWRLAGTLGALFVVVLAVLLGGTYIASRQIILGNAAQAQTDVRNTLACGVSPRDLTRFTSVGLTHGGVVLVEDDGRIVSAPDRLAKTGSTWRGAPAGHLDLSGRIGNLDVHVLLPERVGYVGIAKVVLGLIVLIACAIVVSAFFVTRIVSRYVQARDLREQSESLKLAADIQLASMPQTFPPFPGRQDFDVFATMQPAKEVGGDFYDFFFAGPGRLVFLVADVSGTGVPAALFMMRAKSFLKGLVQTGLPLAEAVTRANAALCEGNEASVFVTAWVGEIDLKTGLVTYVNAEHNPPCCGVRRAGRTSCATRRRVSSSGRSPASRMPRRSFGSRRAIRSTSTRTASPSKVDERNELFGEDRLLAALCDTGLHRRELLTDITRAVARHAAGSAQFDDQTQLELVWRGNAGHR